MSWVENESRKLEENPDPEEDIDLPQRCGRDGSGVNFEGEKEDPEEDLVMAHESVVAVFVQGETSDFGEDLGLLTENMSSNESSALAVKVDRSDTEDSNIPGTESCGSQEACSRDCNTSSIAETIASDISFRRDEEAGAAEHDETGYEPQQDAVTNKSDSDRVCDTSAICELQVSEHNTEAQRSVSGLMEEDAVGALNQQENLEGFCASNEDLEVGHSLHDTLTVNESREITFSVDVLHDFWPPECDRGEFSHKVQCGTDTITNAELMSQTQASVESSCDQPLLEEQNAVAQGLASCDNLQLDLEYKTGSGDESLTQVVSSCPATQDQVVSSCPAPQDQVVSSCPATQDQVVSSCPATQDQVVSSCPATQDQVVSSCPAIQDQVVSSCPATQDQVVSSFPAPQDQVVSSCPATQDQVVSSCPATQDQVVSSFPDPQDQVVSSFPDPQDQVVSSFPDPQDQVVSSFPDPQDQVVSSFPDPQDQVVSSFPDPQDQVVSSCAATQEAHTFYVNEEQSRISEEHYHHDEGDKIQVDSEQSHLTPVHKSLTSKIDIGPDLVVSVTSPDQLNHIHFTSPVSKHEPQAVQLVDHPPYSSSSISVNEGKNSTDPEHADRNNPELTLNMTSLLSNVAVLSTESSSKDAELALSMTSLSPSVAVLSTESTNKDAELTLNMASFLPSEAAINTESSSSEQKLAEQTQTSVTNCQDDCPGTSQEFSPAVSDLIAVGYHSSSSLSDVSSEVPTSGSCSPESSPPPSHHSSPDKALSCDTAMNSFHIKRVLSLTSHKTVHEDKHLAQTKRGQKSVFLEHLRENVNGLQSRLGFGHIQEHNRQLLEQLRIRDEEIAKLKQEQSLPRDGMRSQSKLVSDGQNLHTGLEADDLYLPQIKMLEHTIAQQQKELEALKERMMSQADVAKKTVTALQNELKSRVDQVTKMYEECLKEKNMMVVRFAESEARNMEAKRIIEKTEAKVKEITRDKETMVIGLKAAMLDKQKAISGLEMKCAEVASLQKELEQLKEAVNSSEHRIKWFQNKLKEELESHKETKGNLERTVAKLKEAREETEVIRKDCQAIVKTYQESEEIKSNSLDKELKLKETELRTQIQEKSDTEEIQQMLRKELESLKAQHKDTIEEVKTCKDKIHCLEEEHRQDHQIIENYQEIMQRQKTDNTSLTARINSLMALENDYKRAQEMIQALNRDIGELETADRDLQKDIEACSERESKMLVLQSELSHSNALLRTENTSLSSKTATLSDEVEKLRLEARVLEATVKDLSDKCNKERARRKEERDKMEGALAERLKECNDFKQKWEDEIDNSTTQKRRHSKIVKDLTRQLHQVHKRLETYEGKGDVGSMGSRTNSNGSLSSLENSSRHTATVVNQPPIQEIPAVTGEVEVNKQVLIERIVRLQKSHARKNEKLEFLGEHIQQLLDEIKRKNKIIQSYALREESGAMSTEDMDANKGSIFQKYKAKAQKEMQILLARKGGIMASLYSAQQQDGTMTLELSLQICRKLQAVLEDTILRNITLKENLDTLGEEIARLSQENRQLQLHLQKMEGNVA